MSTEVTKGTNVGFDSRDFAPPTVPGKLETLFGDLGLKLESVPRWHCNRALASCRLRPDRSVETESRTFHKPTSLDCVWGDGEASVTLARTQRAGASFWLLTTTPTVSTTPAESNTAPDDQSLAFTLGPDDVLFVQAYLPPQPRPCLDDTAVKVTITSDGDVGKVWTGLNELSKRRPQVK